MPRIYRIGDLERVLDFDPLISSAIDVYATTPLGPEDEEPLSEPLEDDSDEEEDSFDWSEDEEEEAVE